MFVSIEIYLPNLHVGGIGVVVLVACFPQNPLHIILEEDIAMYT